MGRPLIDLTGKKFNKLTVLKLDTDRSNTRVKYWICKCDCGNIKSIEGSRLKNGTTKACGCLQGGIPKYKIQNKKLYKKWGHMKSRCYNQKDISYKNYGLRGIKVCTEWLNYNNFAEWSLKNGFEEGLELDRIDTNDNYKPSNCRYISRLENSRNRRKSLRFNYKDKNLSLMEIAELENISYKTLWKRLKDNNYDINVALHL